RQVDIHGERGVHKATEKALGTVAQSGRPGIEARVVLRQQATEGRAAVGEGGEGLLVQAGELRQGVVDQLLVALQALHQGRPQGAPRQPLAARQAAAEDAVQLGGGFLEAFHFQQSGEFVKCHRGSRVRPPYYHRGCGQFIHGRRRGFPWRATLPYNRAHSRGAPFVFEPGAEMRRRRPVEPDPTSIGVGKSSAPAVSTPLFSTLCWSGRSTPETARSRPCPDRPLPARHCRRAARSISPTPTTPISAYRLGKSP